MFSKINVPMLIGAMFVLVSLLGILGFLIFSSFGVSPPIEKKKEGNRRGRIEFPVCPFCGGNSSITIRSNMVIATCVLCTHRWAQQGQEIDCSCDSCLSLSAA